MKQSLNIYNKKWWLSGIIAVLVITTGCQKSFLDVNVQGQVPAAQLWQTQTDATNAVNAIYAHLRVWNNVAFAALCVESVGSDDAIKGSTPSDAAFINNYDDFSVTATDGQLNDFWIGQYQNINLCNQVLDSIQQIEMDGSLKARYNAEAKFVRAYSYFRLLRAFGHIPLVLHVPVTNAELNPEQSAPADVWSAIESDLTDAASVLPQSYPPTDVGRATKGAALGLNAKVAMYQKKWDKVLDYTNQVMGLGYSLFPDYYQSFRIENENNPESVFEIQANFVANNADLSNCQYSQIQGEKDVSGVGWGFNIPTNDLVNSFEPGDPRLPATVMFTGTTTPSGDAVPLPQSGSPDKYNMKSYVPFVLAAATNSGADQNKRVMRYAEVLLMNAEANNELGNPTAALTSLNAVRARARANSADPSTTLPDITVTDQTALRDIIWHERRVEMGMEFDRFHDLIRQGRAPAVLGPLGFVAGKNEVWPIPQNQIDISGGKLVQNPGY